MNNNAYIDTNFPNFWKVLRDQQYYELFCEHGLDYILNAGFFFDTAEEEVDIFASTGITCTPYHFMEDRLRKAKKPCVLLTTGALSPIHSGHIEMMTASKSRLENLGWDVVGGYFAPGHDEYISFKLREEAIPIHYRIKYILDKTKDIDWLTVDPWAGIFQTCDINFTDIVLRLRMYLTRYLGIDIPVFYVCGADNARFAKAFEKQGHCVVAYRDEKSESDYHDLVETDRIIKTYKPDASSSTKIRKLHKWEKDEKSAFIRDTYPFEDMSDKLEKELTQLHKLFKTRFKKVDFHFSEVQDEQFSNLSLTEKVITIDPYTENVHRIGVSRLYDCFGMTKLGFCHRPEEVYFDVQINKIPKGTYFLHDDDIYTGETMGFTKDLLESRGINIAGFISYTVGRKNEEIIDTRDFIYGLDYGGLVVVNTKGENVRVPYVYPFVCPFIRSSIEDPMDFSIKVWEVNMRLFDNDKKKYEECKYYRDLLLTFTTKQNYDSVKNN